MPFLTSPHLIHPQISSQTILLHCVSFPHLSPSISPASAFPLEDQVYLGAGALFGRLRTDRPVTQQLLHYGKKETTPIPEGHDKTRLRQSYQLAFNTLKCMGVDPPFCPRDYLLYPPLGTFAEKIQTV